MYCQEFSCNNLFEILRKIEKKDCSIVKHYFLVICRFRDSELEFLALYDSIMKPLDTVLDILQGEVDTFMGSLLPTIVCLTECMKKKKKIERT